MRRLPALAVFARAPRPGKTKTRLIPLLGAEGAARFQAALISDTIGKVATLRKSAAGYLFYSGAGAIEFPLRRSLEYHRQHGRDLGMRLARAFKFLLRTHGCAVIIGTDSPELAPRLLRQAFRELVVCDAVLGPCPDGGYYLIGLRRFDARIFRKIRWGTRFAFRDTRQNLVHKNFSCSVLEKCPDVDRPADFKRLARDMKETRALRVLAPATWRFVRRGSLTLAE
jgi:uncharacterized protein